MKVNHSGRVRVPTFWHLLSDAGPVGRQPERAGDVSAARRPRAWSSRGWTRPTSTPRSRARPSSPSGSGPRSPATASATSGSGAPQSLDELTENARLTAESFRGRAEGGLLADQMVPDWSALMVQFQNLDPFQHRAWRYLNVDETGIDDPAWNARGAARSCAGSTTPIGLLLELADRRGGGDPGRQRPRVRPLPGPGPRQPDPDRRRGRPAARARPAGSGGGSTQAARPPPALGREARRPRGPVGVVRPRRSSPSSRSTGSGRSPSPRTRTRRRWST